ncbi:MAG: LLM class F420-dependent oxidoreductase [Acidimicrobiia bacterium]|nr:LLM class F420-dependent oxidoreductase [Acidimicrobiia bacterium]
MRISIFGGELPSIDAAVAAAKQVEAEGFAGFFIPQIFGLDALTTLAVVGHEVPRIELGTGVVPTYPRHPMMLAAQAMTTQVASGGRLTLGIGLSHQIVIESMFGMSYAKPARHMKEYLSILMPLLHGEPCAFNGETLSFNGGIGFTAEPVPVLVAALGPRMLQLAGEMTEGTVTWMTGPATLESHIVPSIQKAASDAGRPPPRVAASLPVCVTDDVDGARAQAADMFSVYGMLPSYRAMLDREGAAGPADVAIVGDEATVAAGIARVADAGATDFSAAEFAVTSDERRRTRELLRSLL